MTDRDIWVFDAYGTLLDVHAAVRALSAGDEARWAAISRTWREKQLAYTWLTAASGDYVDFTSLTERALDYALFKHSETRAEIRDAPTPEGRAPRDNRDPQQCGRKSDAACD
jgi:2-haloacid dehalogenase